MKIIYTPAAEKVGPSRKLTGWQRILRRLRTAYYHHIDRRIPRLVWKGQEVDVFVAFWQDPLNPDNPLWGLGNKELLEIEKQLRHNKELLEIEKQLRHVGIGFDTGASWGGRIWEWDWSLKGPISVTFRGRCKTQQKRRATPERTLVS